MFALATLTEIETLCPAASLTVMLHIPAATGRTEYDTVPGALEETVTLAIEPEYGLHVSASLYAPV